MSTHQETFAFERIVQEVNNIAVETGVISRGLPCLQRPARLVIYQKGDFYLSGSEVRILSKYQNGSLPLGEDREFIVRDPSAGMPNCVDMAVMHYKVTHRYTDEQLQIVARSLDEHLSECGVLLVANKPPFVEWRWLEKSRRWYRRVWKGDPYFRRNSDDLIRLLQPLEPIYSSYVYSEDNPSIDNFVLSALVKKSSPLAGNFLGSSTLDLDRAYAG